MKKLLIIFVLGCIVTSCNNDIDDYPTIIKGQVIDYYTNNSVSNYSIDIIEEKTGFLSSYSNVIYTISSDTTGSFNYEFTATNGCKYYMISYDGDYEGFDSQELDYEVVNELDLNVKPLKVISLSITNTTNTYKRFCVGDYGEVHTISLNNCEILYINDVIPDAYYELNIHLYENDGSGQNGEYIIKSENIWINNVDTTYLSRSF